MNINIIAPICNTGYGIASANIVNSLVKLGHQPALFPINDKKQLQAHPKLHKSLEVALNNAEMPDFSAPCVRIWHQFDMSHFVGSGPHIGFPIFELDKFTEQERWHLGKGCDRLFVCSQWAQGILYENGLQTKTHYPSEVIPLGVDPEIFYPEKSYRKTTIFFNAGKWEVRKGHDVLAEVWHKAFKPSDDVELWLMCHNMFYSAEENKEWEDKFRNGPMGGKVKFIPYQDTQSQVGDIMRMTDCGIFPIRAEGWNLEWLEMMACGKMTIGTNYSGSTEFTTNNNSRLIPIRELEPAFDGKWFNKQGNWAKLDEQYNNELIFEMQCVHNLKQKLGSQINEESVKTGQKYTWDNTAATIVKAMENL